MSTDDHTQATEAPRYVPNCKHAYMNDGFDCPFCLRDRLAAAEAERDALKAQLDATREAVNAKYWEGIRDDNAKLRAERTPIRAKVDQAVGLVTKLMYELDAHNTVRCEGSKGMRSEVTGQLIEDARAYLATLSDKGKL